jgi:hypothetical protein
MFAEAKKQGFTNDQIKAALMLMWDVDATDKLTMAQASDAIEYFQNHVPDKA